MRRKWIGVFAIAAMLLFNTATAAEGMAYREYPISTTVVVTGDASTSSPESIEVKKGDYIKVILYASGGTGYAWTLATQNSLFAEAVGHSTAPVEGTENLAGGKVRSVFYLKVKADASGQETLKFVLSRSWEKKVPPARRFDLTLAVR